MIVGVGSWRGTGASTTALVLAMRAAARGSMPWLIEADPAGGTLAARIHGLEHPEGSLEHLAFPTRRDHVTQRFADAATPCHGVRVVCAPGDPFRASACHRPRQPWQLQLRDLDADVVVDLGRLRAGAPTRTLVEQLDALLLITSDDPVDIAASAQWAEQRGSVSSDDPPLPLDIARLVVLDRGGRAARSTRTAVEHELDDRLAGWLPWAPSAIDVIERGGSFADRRLRNHPLRHGLDRLLDRIASWSGDEPARRAARAELTEVAT